MARTSLLGTLALVVAGALLWVVPANAQATRTWVSGVGDDANPCSRTAPCKTFAGAISKTADCGEIDALDPGGFGALTITKGITIDGGGGQVASVLVAGTNGFVVNDTSPTCRLVIIRNVKFQGLFPASGAGLTGINVLQGSVVIDHVDIQNFSQDCVNFQSTTAATLTVKDSDFVNCAGAGLEIGFPAGGLPSNSASVTNTTFEDNGLGLLADVNGYIALHDSTVSSNTNGGVKANGSHAWIAIDGSSITANPGFNLYATNTGAISIAANSLTLTGGTTFKSDTGGQLITFSNNWVQFVGALGATTKTAAPN